MEEDKKDDTRKKCSDVTSHQLHTLKKNIEQPTTKNINIYQIINDNLIPINNKYYIKKRKSQLK